MFVSKLSHNNNYSIVYWQWRKSTIVKFFVNLTLMMFERSQRCNNYRHVFWSRSIKIYLRYSNSFEKNINSFKKKYQLNCLRTKKNTTTRLKKILKFELEIVQLSILKIKSVHLKKISTIAFENHVDSFEKNIKISLNRKKSIYWSIKQLICLFTWKNSKTQKIHVKSIYKKNISRSNVNRYVKCLQFNNQIRFYSNVLRIFFKILIKLVLIKNMLNHDKKCISTWIDDLTFVC